MSGSAPVNGEAASLLEVDPRLGSALGPVEAAARGHRPIAPVFGVARGPWAPPPRGPGTVALVVLEGLLLDDAPVQTLAGPLDRVVPWDEEVGWTACTVVRVAIIGTPFVEAVSSWPEVVARLLARAGRAVPARAATGEPEERLLAILWHLAARWGHQEVEGLALPFALEVGILGRLTRLSEAEVTIALVALRQRSAAVPRHAGGWLLPLVDRRARGSLARRDALRARVAEQLALARAARDDCNALCHDLDVQFRLTEARRRRTA